MKNGGGAVIKSILKNTPKKPLKPNSFGDKSIKENWLIKFMKTISSAENKS